MVVQAVAVDLAGLAARAAAAVVAAAVGSSVAAVLVAMVATVAEAGAESRAEVAGLSAWSVLKRYQYLANWSFSLASPAKP